MREGVAVVDAAVGQADRRYLRALDLVRSLEGLAPFSG